MTTILMLEWRGYILRVRLRPGEFLDGYDWQWTGPVNLVLYSRDYFRSVGGALSDFSREMPRTFKNLRPAALPVPC